MFGLAEQLKRVHGEVDKIENNLSVADRTIRGMESIWGSIRNMVSSSGTRGSKPQAAAESQRLDRAVEQRNTLKEQARQAPSGTAQPSASRSDSRAQREYSEDWQGAVKKLEDQQDEDLDHIGRAVKELKVMSKEMGYTLDAQTKSIERLGDRTDAVDSRLAKSNLRVKRML